MEHKKFVGTQMLQESWKFIREQLKKIDSWFFIIGINFLGVIGFFLSIIFFTGITFLYFSLNAPAIFDFAQKPYVFVISIVGLVLVLFLFLQLIKKAIGFLNLFILNALDVALGRPMRRLQNKDERLSCIGLCFLMVILILLGVCLLIVPGIFFMVRSSMAYPIMLEEKCSPFQAIIKSFNMTRGNFWPLLINLVIFSIIFSIPFLNIIIIFTPFTSWNIASLYAQLKNK